MKIPGPFTLGTAQLGLPYGVANRRGLPSEDEATEILGVAWASGIRAFDTAPAYGPAETRLGRFLDGRDACVTTKLDSLRDVADEHLVGTVRSRLLGSLERLRRPGVFGVLLHSAADLARGKTLHDALEAVRGEGLTESWGVSVYEPAEASEALAVSGVALLQIPSNLVDRRWTGTLMAAKGRDVLVSARSVYLQGAFALTPEDLRVRVPALSEPMRLLHEICASYGVAPLSAALAVVANTTGVASVVVGAETPEQVQANVAARAVPVPPGLIEALDGAFGVTARDAIDPRLWGPR